MSEKIQSRLREIAKECGGNRALCDKSGVSERTFANWLAGSSEPKVIGISSIAQAAGVTIDWIVTGAKPKERLGIREENTNDVIQLAWVDHKLADTSGAASNRLQVKGHFPFSRQFLNEKLNRTECDKLCLIEVAGDSMEPTMSPADTVLVDMSATSGNDGLYVYVSNNSLHIKRLISIPSGVEIISDNKELYPAQKISNTDFQTFEVLGKVVWIGKINA